MTVKQVQERLVGELKKWQKIEEESVSSTGEVLAETDNPLIRAIFEIIQRDSQNHRQVQELLIRGYEVEGFKLTVEQFEELFKVVSRHVQVEKRMVAAAEEALQAIQKGNLILHEYFLKYLRADEEKHLTMLEGLEKMKKHITPYGPSL
jgi:hypothetical protein